MDRLILRIVLNILKEMLHFQFTQGMPPQQYEAIHKDMNSLEVLFEGRR